MDSNNQPQPQTTPVTPTIPNQPPEILSTPPPSGGKKLIVLVFVLILLVLALGGGYVYLNYQSQQEADQPVKQTVVTRTPSPEPDLLKEANSMEINEVDPEFDEVDQDLQNL